MTYEFEDKAKNLGFKYVCGVDEAGRGPLAGPVVAAAVILPPGLEDLGFNDSKKLSEKKRNALYDLIIKNALAYSISLADEKEIDTHNILAATHMAMRRAVDSLKIKPDYVLVDGNRPPKTGIEEECIIKGDTKSISIAAASILAKVYRDRLMQDLAKDYPQYLFERHKGYPTALHYQMIREHGISPVHRQSFLKKILQKEQA